MFLKTVTLAAVFSLLLASCTDLDRDSELDVRAVYKKEHPWIGKCAKFELPMVYITNLPPVHFEHAETVRIGRVLSRADDADNLRQMEQSLILTPVPPGTTFEVIAVFTYVYSGLARIFNSNFDMAILRDNHGSVSTLNVSSLRPCH